MAYISRCRGLRDRLLRCGGSIPEEAFVTVVITGLGPHRCSIRAILRAHRKISEEALCAEIHAEQQDMDLLEEQHKKRASAPEFTFHTQRRYNNNNRQNKHQAQQDHFLSLDPTSLTVDLLEQHLLAAETSAVAVGAARGTPRPPFLRGAPPPPFPPPSPLLLLQTSLFLRTSVLLRLVRNAAIARARVAGVVEVSAVVVEVAVGAVVGAAVEVVEAVEVVVAVGLVAAVGALVAAVEAAEGVAAVEAVVLVVAGLDLGVESLVVVSDSSSSVGARPSRPSSSRDYELHSLDFSTPFLQGSLHEEIWLRRPPGFTKTFPAGTQWSLRRPVYGPREAPREWHDTLRTTLAALGFAPATAGPSLFLRTDISLPPFYVLVYVDDLVFATADTEALTLVKSELQKRHTWTDLGELRSYLGLQITRDRARCTITLTQSHMVHQVLQRFGFEFSSQQPTPPSTSHSLLAPPSDESIEPSGPYPELVGCLVYVMTCTRPDLAYPLSLLARYVAPGRHRKVHLDATKRVLRYLCSTSGMGLVLGGRGPVVLAGHADASGVDDSATQRSSQGYTFSLALYVDNKAMIALCQEHRLEHRTKHIALRYFLARELQLRSQLRLAYVATRANTADDFTKAPPPGDHQRFTTVLGLDHFLSLDPTSLTADLLEQNLLAAETSAVSVGAARGNPRPPFFEGCSPSPLPLSYASVAAADVSVAEDVGAASASAKCRSSKGKGGKGGGGGSGGGEGGSGSGGGGSSGGGGGGGSGGGSGGSGGGGGGSGGSGGSGGGGTGGGRTGPWRGGPGGGQRQ
ncbi:unnamed protein product [Closterium sp. NIES-53]